MHVIELRKYPREKRIRYLKALGLEKYLGAIEKCSDSSPCATRQTIKDEVYLIVF